MRVSAVFVVALLACTLVISCAPQQPDVNALRKTVDAFNAATRDVMMNGNPDKVMPYYEDNAMEMAPNTPMMIGKAAIRQFQDQMMQSGMKMTAVEFKTVDLEAGGKIAYEIGTYDMTISMPQAGEIKDRGKYVAIWKQQSDGSWKVHAETWNTDMPMPSMEPSTGKKDEAKGKK